MTTADPERIRKVLTDLARKYPANMVDGQLIDIPRTMFHIDLMLRAAGDKAAVCDIGGGVGVFSVACAALGMSATLVDDFQDSINLQEGDNALRLHKELGVTVDSRDVIRDGIPFAPDSFDVITSFDSVEHWHASPKKVFHRLMECLKPNGTLILGVPNCVNARKRIAVPLGIAQWSSMDVWYEQEVFRGHVREPSVQDLNYISRDLKLRNVRVMGRNWLGLESRRPFVKQAAVLTDRLLQLMPSLCSNLYLIGQK